MHFDLEISCSIKGIYPLLNVHRTTAVMNCSLITFVKSFISSCACQEKRDLTVSEMIPEFFEIL